MSIGPGRRNVDSVTVDPATSPTLATLRRARAQQEGVQRWMRRLAPLLLVGVVAASFGAGRNHGPGGRDLDVVLAAGGFMLGGLGALATRRRSVAANASFVVVLLASSAALMWLEPSGAGLAGLFVGLALVAPQVPDRFPVALLVVGIVCLAVVTATFSRGSTTSAFLGAAAIVGFCGMTFLARRLGQASHQAERLLLELERTRTAQARAAGLAERQRLAREMHDVLAHSLSGLMLQLEAARMLAADAPGDPRLPEIIELAHRLGKTGLEEARGAIGMLRDDELPGPDGLAGLAAQFKEVSGVPCRFTVSGQARVLGPEAGLAVYRVAQEALTNVAKHACPERVEVRLAYEPSATCLAVEDYAKNGKPPKPANHAGGYGLTGMRERAELLGGQLTTAITHRGYRVELRMPG
jgi:signal transduction histidine kinase